jgi:uncharacterized protein (DUF1015 family)
MSRSQTPRILHITSVRSQNVLEGLLRAKWKDGCPVFDFTHVKTLALDFYIFQDIQLTQELFETVSELEELHITGKFTCQFCDLNF